MKVIQYQPGVFNGSHESLPHRALFDHGRVLRIDSVSSAWKSTLYTAIADLKLSMREAGYKQNREKQEPEPISASKDATKAAANRASLGAKNTVNG